MPRRIATVFLAIVLTLVIAAGCGESQQGLKEEAGEEAAAGIEVPEKYADLYNELDLKLGEAASYLEANWDGSKGDTIFSTELIVANSNRGEALLNPATLYAIEITLDSIQTLGIKAVNISIAYPLLTLSFPRSTEYLDFYTKAVAEIRDRGLVVIIDTTTLFPDLDFGELDVSYEGLTLDRYMQEKRAMVQTVLSELKPDYYTIENEPVTQQANTGLDFTVENQTAMVDFFLTGLDRGSTLMGAGAGTWDDMAYFESLAGNTDVDYLDLHIYPIQQDFLVDKTARIAESARSCGKDLAVGEAWLYKAALAELGPGHTPAAAADVFARDPYSFWIPLDESFLESMVALSHHLDFLYMTPFWTQYFFAYLEYDTDMEAQGYTWVNELASSKAWINIQARSLTPTGETYRELISGAGP
ncbi:MAG: hypothetical protein C4536_16165 [Actinobacteria bacterium]|jgi:hypothetical protein|nr:MAG: hypothetical protein C4536_16165 [Actinomycetota bacterium]